MLPPNRGDYEKRRRRRRRRFRPDGGARSGPDRLQGHGLRSRSEPGGMLTVGVPVFRLPRELVQAGDQRHSLAGRRDLKCNMRLGRDFTISSLRREGYKAIFLGIGLPKGRKLPSARRRSAKASTTAWISCAPSMKASRCRWASAIVVIGGGNVAYDVARSAVRPLDALARSEDAMPRWSAASTIAYDVARSALRMSGDKEVHVVCLEKRAARCPPTRSKSTKATKRASTCTTRRGPREILGEQRQSHRRCAPSSAPRVFDANGRFNPTLRRDRRRGHPGRHHHLRHRPDLRSFVPRIPTMASKSIAA